MLLERFRQWAWRGGGLAFTQRPAKGEPGRGAEGRSPPADGQAQAQAQRMERRRTVCAPPAARAQHRGSRISQISPTAPTMEGGRAGAGGPSLGVELRRALSFAPALTPPEKELSSPRAGVVSWKQCLSDNQAWDTLTWFAALIAMAAYLNKFGFIAWFSDKVGGQAGAPWARAGRAGAGGGGRGLGLKKGRACVPGWRKEG